MNIPFIDLKIQYQNLKKEIDSAIKLVIDNTAFVRGKHVKDFENNFSSMFNTPVHTVSCANGTDAIYIALRALGVKYGDEVITVCNSWISSSEVITQIGAKPVFVDIEPKYYNMDVDKIEEKITSKTKAIIPVHLFGQPVYNMDKLLDISKKHNLRIIEDCAQSHFSMSNNRHVGTLGDIGTFSFYPGKNLGAYGDAGAIVTKDKDLAETMTMIANHGSLVKHAHKIEGINSRLDGIQAAILDVKVNYLKEWNNKRKKIADLYRNQLKDIEHKIILPAENKKDLHTYHLFVVQVKDREKLANFLKEKGISTGIHYPTPLPYLEAYSYLNHEIGDFPEIDKISPKILSLPIFPEMNTDQVTYVCNNIKKFYS